MSFTGEQPTDEEMTNFNYYIYDIEVYPNIFTLAVESFNTGKNRIFEFSNRIDELDDMLCFIDTLPTCGNSYMVGFNNLFYDYPVLHYIINNHRIEPSFSPAHIYEFSKKLITSKNKFSFSVWPSDMVVPQLDLFKINHFDNKAKSTSLKIIEFNNHAGWLQELPFAPGTHLSDGQMDELRDYNLNRDVKNTVRFFKECLPDIEFRLSLSQKYGIDFSNCNESKIGGDYLTLKLIERKYGRIRNNIDYFVKRKKFGKSPRKGITLPNVILPYVKFESAGFRKVFDYLNSISIIETKKCFKNLTANFNGLNYEFGTGGIHACIVGKKEPPRMFKSDSVFTIVDVDVKSYYPNLAIANGLYPEHLGAQFCDAYSELYQERSKHPKGSMLNKLYKLALNGTYGNSNSKYSVFYDPKFTMSITINGQLLLCMLAEKLQSSLIESEMIQVNTDGLTIKIKRSDMSILKKTCDDWEKLTDLVLENVQYSKLLIKDVNNYAAMNEKDSKIKLKGKYEYDKPHYKNHSALVIPKVLESYFKNPSLKVDELIRDHDDGMDFMLRTKIPKNSRLELGGRVIQNISRYYVSINGAPLEKIMPPLPENPNKERRIGIHVGWEVEECNEISTFKPENINYDFYYEEALKLLDK